MSDTDHRQQFNQSFDKYFHHTLNLVSEKSLHYWADFEHFSVSLAGPLYEIRERGNCKYVFSGRHEAFVGIKTLPDLAQWFALILQDLNDFLDTFIPENADEELDLLAYRSFASGFSQVVNLGLQIQADYIQKHA